MSVPIPPEAERAVGMERYGTATPGVGGVLRQTPADFRVEEIPRREPRGSGRYLIVEVEKENWDTQGLVRALARALRISRKRISFAGMKDRNAVTVQRMSFFGVRPAALESVRLAGVRLRAVGLDPEPVGLGDLESNRFSIVLRAIPLPAEEVRARAEATAAELRYLGGAPNFFGLQRFGERRAVTHRVGELLVRGDVEGAMRAYLADEGEGEGEATRAARRLAREGDFKGALAAMPKSLGFEKALLNRLIAKPDDWGGALEALPAGLRTLFVHGFQARLFNRVLSERLARGLSLAEPVAGDILLLRGGGTETVAPGNIEAARRAVAEGRARVSGPLFGPEAPVASGEPGEIERGVLEGAGIAPEDFARGPVTSKGRRRALLLPAPVKWEGGPDERSPGCVALKLKFSLEPGAYATVVLREFTKA
ncbi:MAG: tRNA pseudouridine(13) synthase TruD [Halobacteria archaeon]